MDEEVTKILGCRKQIARLYSTDNDYE